VKYSNIAIFVASAKQVMGENKKKRNTDTESWMIPIQIDCFICMAIFQTVSSITGYQPLLFYEHNIKFLHMMSNGEWFTFNHPQWE
jgi:uncharacterized membrane protein YadS